MANTSQISYVTKVRGQSLGIFDRAIPGSSLLIDIGTVSTSVQAFSVRRSIRSRTAMDEYQDQPPVVRSNRKITGWGPCSPRAGTIRRLRITSAPLP